MSDDGRDRTSLAVEVCKSSQKWGERRSAGRSIAWLGERGCITLDLRKLRESSAKEPSASNPAKRR
jgi:hypothetical protein